MDRHLTSAQLKSRAKGQLLGKYGTLIPVVIIVQIIVSVLTFMTTFALDTRTIPGLVLQFLIEILIQLFAGIFVAGQAYLYLKVSCGGNINVSDVFYGFTHHPDKAILIQLFQLLLGLAFFVPFIIFFIIWSITDAAILVLFLSITFCIGLVGCTVLSLMYSQSFFVLLDFPEFSAIECMRFSRRIMKGSKARRFYLEISFVPLYLLGFLTCCIGLLFLFPYINATYSNFYLELMDYRNKHQNQNA